MAELTDSRTWATVIYPEDNECWLQVLEDLKIPCYVSPEHNMDIDDQGNLKKNHRHILFVFSGKKSPKQMKMIVDELQGVGLEQVKSLKGYLFYLCHLMSPNKHHYAVEDVLSLNGATDYLDEVGATSVSHHELVNQMLEWCAAENVFCFSDLVDYARTNRKDWFRILVDKNSHLIFEYLKSRNWKHNR